MQKRSATYAYTGNGALAKKTSASGTTVYTMDDFGQLSSVTLPDGRTVTYLTGGENQRLEKRIDGVTVRRYVYSDALRLIGEVNPDFSVRSTFVYATESHSPDLIIQSGTAYRLIKDHLGSIRLVVNSESGAIAQRLDYDEFGRVIQDTNPGFQPFGFAGGIYDKDTKLVRFGARD